MRVNVQRLPRKQAWEGDNKYGKASNTTLFDASRVNSTVVIDVNSTEVGKSVVIVVYVPGDAAGKISIVVDSKQFDEIVDGGKAVFNIPDLAKGNYTVAATFIPSDEKYNGNTNSTKFEVTARYTNLDVVVSPITYGEDAKIVVTVPGNATGYVTITIGDNTYLANIDKGTAKFSISNLEPGVVNLEIAYSGDDDYYANTTNANITISPKSTSIDVIAGDIDKGDVAVITVIVSNGANGVVVITVDGIITDVNWFIDVNELLIKVIKTRGLKIEPTSIINDTTATLLTGNYKNKNADMKAFEEGGEILRQVKLAFDYPYTNNKGEDIYINKVIVVVNGTISNQAKNVMQKNKV